MHIWNEISESEYDFDRNVKLAERLTTISVSDVKLFFDKYIKCGSPDRVKFSSQFYGKDVDFSVRKECSVESPTVVYIDDPTDFKRSMNLRGKASYLNNALEIASNR